MEEEVRIILWWQTRKNLFYLESFHSKCQDSIHCIWCQNWLFLVTYEGSTRSDYIPTESFEIMWLSYKLSSCAHLLSVFKQRWSYRVKGYSLHHSCKGLLVNLISVCTRSLRYVPPVVYSSLIMLNHGLLFLCTRACSALSPALTSESDLIRSRLGS